MEDRTSLSGAAESPFDVLVAGLPKDFPAAVLIGQHLDPRHKSLLVDLTVPLEKFALAIVRLVRRPGPAT